MKNIEKNLHRLKLNKYKKIPGFIAFTIIMIMVNGVLKMFLIDPCNYQLPIRDFYKTDGFDTIFLGSCHSYGSIDPTILDDRLGIKSYNLGSADQSIDTSYFLLKEAVKRNNIKTVYLELYYDIWLMDPENYKERQIGRISDIWGVMDVVPFSVNKAEYMLSATNKEYYFMSLFPVCRERQDIFNSEQLQKNLEQNMKYLQRDYSQNRGFRAHRGNMSKYPIVYTDVCTADMISGDNLEYMNKIITFCKRRGIELILYSAPMWDGLLMEAEYDKYISLVEELCNNNDLKYYDFNLVSPEYMRLDVGDFYDCARLNEAGSEKFMEVFSNFINGNYPENIFLGSYREKTERIEEGIYGCGFHRITDEAEEVNGLRKYEIYAITNVSEQERIRYSIKVTGENEDQEVSLAPSERGYTLVVPLDDEGEPLDGNINIIIYLDDEEMFHYEGEL